MSERLLNRSLTIAIALSKETSAHRFFARSRSPGGAVYINKLAKRKMVWSLRRRSVAIFTDPMAKLKEPFRYRPDKNEGRTQAVENL